MQAATILTYDVVRVQVPHIELKRFKTIAKALGCTIEKQSAIERSLAEAEAGLVEHYDCLEDLVKAIAE